MFRQRRIAVIAAAAWSALAIESCTSSTSPNGPVGSVEVTPAADSVVVGKTITLRATVMSRSGQVVSGQHVFWNTGKASVATVSHDGVVTGVARGTVQIAASAGGASGIATVTVLPPRVASVSVSPRVDTIVLGGTVQLTATPLDASHNALGKRPVTWASDLPNVANVDAGGLVTGVSAGSATITATSEGRSGSATIIVRPPVAARVVVTPARDTLTVGSSTTLTATVKDAHGRVLGGAPTTWSSSKPSAVSVSAGGTVKAVSAGAATITARSGNASGTAAIVAVAAPAPPPPPPPGHHPKHGPGGP